jgi:hypothetical protein
MVDPIPPKTSWALGQYALRALGGLLLAFLCVSVVVTLVREPLVARLPQIPGLARGGEVSGLPSSEMNAALERSKQVMYARYREAHRYAWSSRIVDWIGFGLTSSITLIAGALGRGPRPGEDPAAAAREALEAGSTRGRRWVNTIGGIAALASVMVALSSRLQSESQRAMDHAEKMRALVSTARKDFLNAATPEDALSIVSNLDAETRKDD